MSSIILSVVKLSPMCRDFFKIHFSQNPSKVPTLHLITSLKSLLIPNFSLHHSPSPPIMFLLRKPGHFPCRIFHSLILLIASLRCTLQSLLLFVQIQHTHPTAVALPRVRQTSSESEQPQRRMTLPQSFLLQNHVR